MDLSLPIRTIMTPDPITVAPSDNLKKAEQLFEENKIHHLPVIDEGKVIGILSKSDLLLFRRGRGLSYLEGQKEEYRLEYTKIEEIMISGLAKMTPEESIDIALAVFEENILHAILVVEGAHLRGIVTPLDIIHALISERRGAS